MKLMPSFDLLPRMRSINLIPFRETLFVNNKINYKDVIYNVLVFIPLGIYLKIIFQKWPIYKIIVTGLLVSTSYESIQYIFAIGCSDITDIITNTSGTLIGIAISSVFTSKNRNNHRYYWLNHRNISFIFDDYSLYI